jgi:uncharacterized protein YkwD
MARCRLVLAAFAVFTAVLAFAAVPVAADPPGDALRQINAYRVARGVPPLRLEARLTQLARDHARDMVKRQYFNLRAPAGMTLEARLLRAGYAYRQAAQQIAVGYADGRAIVERWFEDGDSRQALLNPLFSEIGIGYARRGSGLLDHYWAVVLAQPTRKVAAAWRRAVLARVNRFRARYGLMALRFDDALNRAAQAHADDMAARDYFSHVTPDGRSVGDRATQAGYRWATVLENIAVGQGAPSEVVAGWIGSPAHRRAMLARDIDDAGIGYRFLARDGGRTRQNHYWALVMGRKRPVAAR